MIDARDRHFVQNNFPTIPRTLQTRSLHQKASWKTHVLVFQIRKIPIIIIISGPSRAFALKIYTF